MKDHRPVPTARQTQCHSRRRRLCDFTWYQANGLKIWTRHISLRCKVRRPTQGRNGQVAVTYALAFRSAQRAFIIADNFFRMAALIGLRPVVFLEAGVAFFGADLPFRFAQRCFIAAEIRLRAAGLIRRRFLTRAGLAWLPLGGRPRRTGWEPSPVRASIACSMRLASCLSCATML